MHKFWRLVSLLGTILLCSSFLSVPAWSLGNLNRYFVSSASITYDQGRAEISSAQQANIENLLGPASLRPSISSIVISSPSKCVLSGACTILSAKRIDAIMSVLHRANVPDNVISLRLETISSDEGALEVRVVRDRLCAAALQKTDKRGLALKDKYCSIK